MKPIAILSALIFGFGLALANPALAAGDQYGTTGTKPGTTDMQRPRGELPPGHPPVVLSEKAHRASEFIGKDVENPRGKEIGEVSELILDPDTGRVSHAVVSVTGIPGLADRMIAVPFTALNPKPDDPEKLVLNIEMERLRQAPNFETREFPGVMTPEWLQRADDFFAPGTMPPEIRGN
jgi:sporulation protein YlmC with PRC-barrel domain